MYNWENSKTKSKSKSNSKYNDPYDPTFSSSSLMNKFNKSLKTHPSKSFQNEDTTTKTPKNRAKTSLEDEKISSLRRACLVEKWMEKKVSEKGKVKSNSRSSSTLLEEFDLHDTLFSSFSTTNSTNNTTTSSSSDETEYPVFPHPKQKTLSTCFPPHPPKPIKTNSIESKFLTQFSQEKDENSFKSRSRAAQVYSNLKNLKQPISPGVRLTSFINSLFTKQGKNSTKQSTKQRKTEEITTTTSSTCSSVSSFSRSCLMSKNRKFQDDGIKRTVRFCPVSVIVDDDSQPCGYKSLQEESEKDDVLLNTKFKRSISKRYQELKRLNNGLESGKNDIMDIQQHQKKLEEVALDLLSGYWDARLNNKSHDLSSKIINDDDYQDDDDDDGFSCSSSDLFELDNLSLIGNELPVYETTQFDNKIM